MILNNDVINSFAEKGISVRYYPDKTFEDFKKRMWQKSYEYAYNYGKNHVKGCEAVINGTANEVYASEAEFEKHCRDFADMDIKYNKSTSSTLQDVLYIEYDGKLIIKKIAGKYKEVTRDFIQKQIDKNEKMYGNEYGKLVIIMMSLLHKELFSNSFFTIYPTSYGIGVFILYNFEAEKCIELVRKIMDKYGIEYYNEYSEAAWVYRFKVSKKSINIAKLQSATL